MKQAVFSLVVLLIVSSLSYADTPHETTQTSKQIVDINTATSITNIPVESLFQVLTAEIALDRNEPEIALANYIAAAKQTQDKMIAKRATEIALMVASLEIALEPATLWATLANNDLESQITLAAIYLRLHQPKEAIPYLIQLSQISPELANQHFLLLYQQLPNEGERSELISALKQISKTYPQSLGAELSLAEILLSQNNAQEAVLYSQAAIKKQPQSVESIRIHSLALAYLKRLPEAKQFVVEKLKESPSLNLKQYYLDFLVTNGETQDAKKTFHEITTEYNLSEDQKIELAKFAMQSQWFKEAETLLLTIRKSNTHKDIAHYFLARLAEINTNSKSAIEWYKQVLTGPFHVLSQIRASLLLSESKNYQDALKVLSRAQPQNSEESKRLLISEIDILMQSNQNQTAFDKLNKAINEYNDDVELRYTRSIIATSLRNFDFAERDLKWIIEHQKNHVDALNALGYLLTNYTTRYQEAYEYLNKAIKLSPNNPIVLDSMGWLQYKMGNLEQSLALLQRAANLDPDPEIAAHLGEVLWKMKDYKKAQEVWNNGLALNPDDQTILNAKERLLKNK